MKNPMKIVILALVLLLMLFIIKVLDATKKDADQKFTAATNKNNSIIDEMMDELDEEIQKVLDK